MSKTTRYYPLNPKELQLYKRSKAIEETSRTDKTNDTLIALRRRNLNVINSNPPLKQKIERFNSYIKSRKQEEILKVINFLMSDLYNDGQVEL